MSREHRFTQAGPFVPHRGARTVRCRAMIETCERRLLLASLPPGFVEVQLSAGLTSPTAIEIASDGRVFIAEQRGTIRILKDDQLLQTPFADLSADVDSSNERGLLGITLDPLFDLNHYVYVYYSAKTPVPHNRLSRLTANGDTFVPGSEVALVDFPDIGNAIWHMGGAIHFGPDGKIYVGVGDHQQPPKAQQLDNVFGKVLRFNSDGSIPADNPFYTTTTGVNRSIWNLGLRNPFTFDFDPVTGRLFINDVGDGVWEEINDGVKGANFGWPQTEGNFNQASFPNFKRPFHAYPHSLGQCITGGVFYNPATLKFPAEYHGQYFFSDFSQSWMKVIDPATGVVSDFGSGFNFPTDASAAPNGAIYFIQRGNSLIDPMTGFGSIHKIDYVLDTPPTIVVQPAGQSGAAGQQATFSVAASGTSPLSYQWQRNGQDIDGATSDSYTLTIDPADHGALFRCVVTNAINSVTSGAAMLTVLPGSAPVASIEIPAVDFPWIAGQTVQFSGSAIDADDGDLPAGAFTWQVDYITGNISRPLLVPTSGMTAGSFDVPVNSPYTGTSVSFRIILKVTDSDGVVATATRDILPQVSNVTLTTNVPGLTISIDGTPHLVPYSVDGVVNLERVLEAPATQVIAGNVFQFVSWSDGGARVHQINWPAADTIYTATYAAAGTAPFALPDSAVVQFNQPEPIDVLANDFDLDGTIDPATVTITTPPQHGDAAVDPITGVVTYTSATGYGGPDAFYYTVMDDSGATSLPARVNVSVVGAPQPWVYLSDLTPALAQNGFGPYERDTSNGHELAGDGNPITLNGVVYPRGLGVHAPSELRFSLAGGNYVEFRAFVGIDDEAGSNGSSIFQVWLDDVLKYTSPLMTATSPTQQVIVDVRGGSTLQLVVTDGGVNTNIWDHADWADAKLTLAQPDAPDLSAASDSGASDSDDLTNVTTPTFVGSALPGAIVRVFADGVLVATTTSAADGSWSAQTSPLSEGSHEIAVALVNVDGFVGPFSEPLHITIDTTPPAAGNGQFLYETAPLRLRFDIGEAEPIGLELADLLVSNLGGEPVPALAAFSFDPVSGTATFAFESLLPDGRYRAVLPAGAFTDRAGNALGADVTLDFFHLAGDANHDGKVDVADLGILASNWQQTGVTFSQGDFDYNGVVDVNDLGILASRWQYQLPEPAVSRAAAPRTPVRTPRAIDQVNVEIMRGV